MMKKLLFLIIMTLFFFLVIFYAPAKSNYFAPNLWRDIFVSFTVSANIVFVAPFLQEKADGFFNQKSKG